MWVIARGKLVAARSVVMFKTPARRFQIAGGCRWVVYGCMTSHVTSRGDLWLVVARPVAQLVIQLVVRCHNWQSNQLWLIMTSCMTLILVAWPDFPCIKKGAQSSISMNILSTSWQCSAEEMVPKKGKARAKRSHPDAEGQVNVHVDIQQRPYRWSSMSSSLRCHQRLSPEPTPSYYICDWSCNQSWQSAIGRATSHSDLRLVIQSIIAICDWSCDCL